MTVDTPYATVRTANDTDLTAALDVFVRAFANDPVACWLFPEPGERPRLLSRFHGSAIAHPAGELYLAGHRSGAALWLTLDAGRSPHEPRPGASEADPAAAFGDTAPRLTALGRALAQCHPVDEPHLYLWCMGVVGARRGTGLGSAMLRHRLARADADGLAAYLEASSPGSRALYQRFGFTDLGEPVQVADGPPLWPMRRPPRH